MTLSLPTGKQAELILKSDAWINIAEGSVRSGKTVGFIFRWLDYIVNDAPEGELIICGKTRDTVKRNIIDELIKWLPEEDIKFKQNEVIILGRRHYIVGGNDERAEQKIRGLTLAGALVDECTTLPESFFMMLMSRLSVKGAKAFISTNPDSPNHWLLKNYLEKKDLDLKRFKFSLEDNLNLDPKYVENLKNTYTGLWYRRFILGEWCLAEGIVYDAYDEKTHVVDDYTDYDYFSVGVDYGTSNPCVFLLCGIYGDNVDVVKEYYWSSAETHRQKTDAEYSHDLAEFTDGYNIKGVIVDPSALSLITQLRKDGFRVRPAKNDVLPGIATVAKYLHQEKLHIHKSCKNLIKEFSGYVWDENAQKKGEDKPKKESDHCFVAGTLVTTNKGDIPIEEIKQGDLVLTREGYFPVKAAGCTNSSAEIWEFCAGNTKLHSTGCHPIYVLGKGYIPLDTIRYGDFVLTKNIQKERSSYSTKYDLSDIQDHQDDQTDYILNTMNYTYIGKYGNPLMGTFQSVIASIIKMATRKTTQLKTLIV